jgi:hypothetical protein
MKCPNCSHSFELTWKRYFSTAVGQHRCPTCRAMVKVCWSWKDMLITWAICFLGGVPIALPLYCFVGPKAGLIGLGIGCLIVGLWSDKLLDAHFRELKVVHAPLGRGVPKLESAISSVSIIPDQAERPIPADVA